MSIVDDASAAKFTMCALLREVEYLRANQAGLVKELASAREEVDALLKSEREAWVYVRNLLEGT